MQVRCKLADMHDIIDRATHAHAHAQSTKVAGSTAVSVSNPDAGSTAGSVSNPGAGSTAGSVSNPGAGDKSMETALKAGQLSSQPDDWDTASTVPYWPLQDALSAVPFEGLGLATITRPRSLVSEFVQFSQNAVP